MDCTCWLTTGKFYCMIQSLFSVFFLVTHRSMLALSVLPRGVQLVNTLHWSAQQDGIFLRLVYFCVHIWRHFCVFVLGPLCEHRQKTWSQKVWHMIMYVDGSNKEKEREKISMSSGNFQGRVKCLDRVKQPEICEQI